VYLTGIATKRPHRTTALDCSRVVARVPLAGGSMWQRPRGSVGWFSTGTPSRTL